MATTLHLDPVAARLAQERADRIAEERLNEVMSSPHYEGNETLAKTLLGLSGPHRMLAGEIITALSKAPKPAALPPSAPSRDNMSAHDITMAHFGATPKQVDDARLYEAGATLGKFLLGKK